jgi:AraC-like DNA-binding protein
VIFIAGMTIAVFFEILLITKKNKSTADNVLAVWMFLITVHLFLFYLSFTGEIFNYPFLLGTGMPLPLLQGVFLYLYVGSVTNQLSDDRKLLLLHFVPATAMYLYLISFFILPAEEKILVFRNQGAGYETFSAIRSAAVLISGVVYVAWATILLRRHKRRILDLFSYRQRVDLRWLQVLVWGMGAIWLLVFFQNDVVVFGGVTVFVFLIGFFGIRQVRIFDPEPAPPPDETGMTTGTMTTGTITAGTVTDGTMTAGKTTAGKEKYVKSGLNKERAEQLYREVSRLMKEEAVYKKSDLTLDDLASRLKVHSNYLSQALNELDGRNFYDFVNFHRLEEFKRLLSDPKNRSLTLLSLAFDCGFNSKSSFNRHFKKMTGQTPSEYFSSLGTD